MPKLLLFIHITIVISTLFCYHVIKVKEMEGKLMSYPRILIDTEKVKSNVEKIVNLAGKKGISVAGVTKGFSAYEPLVETYIQGGVKYLADSRIENLKVLKKYSLPKMLIRIPMMSEADEVVEYADISLNSEVDTIRALNDAAIRANITHNIILMVDMGDLREGYFNEEDIYSAVEEIKTLANINILGIGTNFTCYGGVIPNEKLHNRQVEIYEKIKARYGLEMGLLSGGNSSSVHLLYDYDLKGITNLRLGEAIIFGTCPSRGDRFPGTYNDAFTLEAEIVEIKHKPSVPTEEIGRDAFGKTPVFVDKGIRKRIICAVGKQDMDIDTLYPLDEKITIIGGSSDHLILDGSVCEREYRIGDIIKFNIHYVSMLRIMNSKYIEKVLINQNK